jgi:hypothetical protein
LAVPVHLSRELSSERCSCSLARASTQPPTAYRVPEPLWQRLSSFAGRREMRTWPHGRRHGRCAAWASSSENTTSISISNARHLPRCRRCAALQDDWPRRSHPASSLTVPQHRRALFRRTPQLSAAPFPLSTFPSRSCRRRRPAPFLHAITVPLYGVPSAYLASSLVCRRRLCPTQSTQSTQPTTRPPLALHFPTYQPSHRPLTRHAPARARFGSPMASCATLSSARGPRIPA